MATEAPSQTYYPRARVKLIVRFDEFGKKVFTGKVPKKPTKNLKGVKDQRAPLQVSEDPEAPAGVSRFQLMPPGSGYVAGGPQDQVTSEDELTHVLDGIVPKNAKLLRNGLRIADTFEVTLRFIDCPVDPRTIRSCGVKFYFGTVDEKDHIRGIEGATRGGADGFEGASTESLPDEYIDVNGRRRTNLRFTGFVDKWEVNWTDSGEPTIKLTCRDNTQLVIDTDAPMALMISAKLPLDRAIGDYLAHFPQFAGLSVEYRGDGKAPALGDALAKTAFRPELGPPPAKGGGAGGDSKLSVWDYLTDVCMALGHNIRLEGNLIIIQKARTLMSSGGQLGGNARPDDPYVPNHEGQYRRFIYGRNILSMRTARNFTRQAPTNIEVRSYSTKRKKVVVGRFPSTGDAIADAKPGAVGADEKWRVIEVDGIDDEETLRIIAQNYYEMVGRNEIEVQLRTKNLASFGGGNLDPDILDMQAGDSFELLVNREEDFEFSSMTRVEKSLSVMERSVSYMKSLGFPVRFAKAYAKAYTDAGFQTVFRCKTLSMSWDIDAPSVEFDIVGVNYVEVRADVTLNGK